MIYVTLPTTTEEKRLTYYLAMEEYVARHMESDDYFFMWQVTPTVIFGRNQLIQSEVNLEYCRTHGINIPQKKRWRLRICRQEQHYVLVHHA